MNKNQNKEKLFDVRRIQRAIYDGEISKKELDEYLKNLEDSSELMEEINLDDEKIKEETSDTQQLTDSNNTNKTNLDNIGL